jgi:hypothetical protein
MPEDRQYFRRALGINGGLFAALVIVVSGWGVWLREVRGFPFGLLIALSNLQFFLNVVLSLVLWKRERPELAWALLASGTLVPLLGGLLLYGVRALVV